MDRRADLREQVDLSFLHHFGQSLKKALIAAYPEHNWDVARFSMGMGSFSSLFYVLFSSRWILG